MSCLPTWRQLASARTLDYAEHAVHTMRRCLALRDLVPLSKQPASIPDFSKGDGLIPAIAQDADTGEVLMLAYMNKESYAQTLTTGQAVYFSRSRNRLWRKGEESGHVQDVLDVRVDCDGDTVLLKVRQRGGAACHQGYRSCFFRQAGPDGLKVVGQRVFDPAQVYEANE